jgi:hypothetical protein
VVLETQAINGSRSTISVDVLSKGSLVLAIRDNDWKHRINLVFGWTVGKEFSKVLLHLKDGRLATAGEIVLTEVFLIRLPKDKEILLNAFFCERRYRRQCCGLGLQGVEYTWVVEGMAEIEEV